MLQDVPRRGRPKGTGINDTATLLEIDRLLTADPRLRPTTAIKMLGFSDPSTIRRLRDKYAVFQAEHGREVDIDPNDLFDDDSDDTAGLAGMAGQQGTHQGPHDYASPRAVPMIAQSDVRRRSATFAPRRAAQQPPKATAHHPVMAPTQAAPPNHPRAHSRERAYQATIAMLRQSLEQSKRLLETQQFRPRAPERCDLMEVLVRQQLLFTETMLALAEGDMRDGTLAD